MTKNWFEKIARLGRIVVWFILEWGDGWLPSGFRTVSSNFKRIYSSKSPEVGDPTKKGGKMLEIFCLTSKFSGDLFLEPEASVDYFSMDSFEDVLFFRVYPPSACTSALVLRLMAVEWKKTLPQTSIFGCVKK